MTLEYTQSDLGVPPKWPWGYPQSDSNVSPKWPPGYPVSGPKYHKSYSNYFYSVSDSDMKRYEILAHLLISGSLVHIWLIYVVSGVCYIYRDSTSIQSQGPQNLAFPILSWKFSNFFKIFSNFFKIFPFFQEFSHFFKILPIIPIFSGFFHFFQVSRVPLWDPQKR